MLLGSCGADDICLLCFIVYRLNTYPVIHQGLFHALLNALALAPLLERFEAEHGTLTSLALFAGRMCSSLMRLLWVEHV